MSWEQRLTAADFDTAVLKQITCANSFNYDTLHLNRPSGGTTAGWHTAHFQGNQAVSARTHRPAPFQMPCNDRGLYPEPPQDTWHWRELSVLPEPGACQATAAGAPHITPPAENIPITPQVPLSNPTTAAGHAGLPLPQCDHCCAPGQLSPPYQRAEAQSSAQTQKHWCDGGAVVGWGVTCGYGWWTGL